MLLGATTILREGLPNFPTPSRPWDIIDLHRATHYYTAPTALRLLKKDGNQHLTGQLDSLRAIGCVGEPLAPEVWRWCHEAVGKGRVHVLDVSLHSLRVCIGSDPALRHSFRPKQDRWC